LLDVSDVIKDFVLEHILGTHASLWVEVAQLLQNVAEVRLDVCKLGVDSSARLLDLHKFLTVRHNVFVLDESQVRVVLLAKHFEDFD